MTLHHVPHGEGTGPSLILCGRQDSVTGYEDQYALLGVLIDDWLARIASGPTSR